MRNWLERNAVADVFLGESERLYIRRVASKDRIALLDLARESQEFHQPWISPPLTRHTFRIYLKRTYREDTEGLVCCLRENHQIVGAINLNDITWGSLLSASIAYYTSAEHAGRGYMTEALDLALEHAFLTLGLHRIEAMIQPGNTRSQNLVRRCGFHYEGLAQQYQYINGEWCDHERWTKISKESRILGHEGILWSNE